MYRTYDEARMALEEARMDVAADHGEQMVEDAWRDIVHVVADQCTPEVAGELLRREGFDPCPPDHDESAWRRGYGIPRIPR